MNSKKEQYTIKSFLAEVNYLPDFLIEKAEKKGYILDYSVESLNELERYLSTENIQREDEDQQLSAMYLGELIIKNYGGEWFMELENPKDIDFAIPTIKGHSNFDVSFNPFHAVSIYILRKIPRTFYKAIMADIKPSQLDLNLYPTEE